METFAVIQVKGDEIRTLQICGSKEEAIAVRQRFRQRIPPGEGGVYVISSDFDAGGRLRRRSFLLY